MHSDTPNVVAGLVDLLLGFCHSNSEDNILHDIGEEIGSLLCCVPGQLALHSNRSALGIRRDSDSHGGMKLV